MTDPAQLSPRLAELVQYANTARGELEAFVQGVPAALHGTRADVDRWTIAEHLEHLALIEDSIGRLISSMAKQLRADNALETEQTSMMGSLDQYQLTQTTMKLSAPEPYRPTGTLTSAEALEKLRAIRVRVLEGVSKANGIDLSKASFAHPFFGPLDGYQWLLLVGQHEWRHLNQMKEDVQKLTAPPSAAPQVS
ncbi:MAG: DinB family protein [Gemmatimonadaceae bacterium]